MPDTTLRTPVRIGDLLLEKGLITQEQIDQALASQKDGGHRKLLGEVLVERGFVAEDVVVETLAQAYDIPFIRVHPRLVDPATLDALPREFLEKNGVLPMFKVNGTLTLAMHEPSNVFLIEEVERLTQCQVQLVAATAGDIRAVIDGHLPNSNVFVIDDIVEDIQAEQLTMQEDQFTDLAMLEEGASTSPVIKLVNYIVHCAVEDGASDIHIEPGDKSLRVRYRIDGRLFEKMQPPYQMHPAVVSRIKIMAGLDISERRVPQDGGITVMLSKHPIDLRVSTMPGKFGEKVVVRILDNRNVMTSLESLGFETPMFRRWEHVISHPNGIVLVTGPTGSGKSTTLYATLNKVNDDALNVCTVEDPVEYQLAGINQFQVHEKAGFTFAGALRSLLRQDPDIIMVGEIRDSETARIAVQAALTGHLVFSTLHTNDAPSAVTRLFNIGVEPYLVAAALRGVLAQRLVRRICSQCKQAATITPVMRKALDRLGPQAASIETVYHGAGCTKCHNTGYRGRVGVYELFVPDDEALDAMIRGASLQELRRIALASGQTTLFDDGVDKVRAGLTTLEELFSLSARKVEE